MMEAEYVGARRRRRITVLLGLVLAVVAAGAVYYLVSRPTTAPPVAQRTIVVAAQAIPARTVITAAMLRTETVPDDPALSAVVRDPAEAVNSLALVSIAAGDVITRSMFGSGNAAGISILGPEETVAPDSPIWRAVSVSVAADRAVGGFISPGDHIDLFVTLAPQLFDPSGGYAVPSLYPYNITDPGAAGPLTLGYYSAQTTKLTWTNLEVLSVDKDKNLYVLKVDEHMAEEIAHVQATQASFTMGLRPPADDRDVDRSGYGQTTNLMIDSHGFLIPNMIEIPPELPSPAP
jgi:Flp pilus assembly protein CpaB